MPDKKPTLNRFPLFGLFAIGAHMHGSKCFEEQWKSTGSGLQRAMERR